MIATIRFSKVVEAAGKPIVHLLWMDPAEDTNLQKAIKAARVMTIHQSPGATKADYGTVGFDKDASSQVLIFPKSLKQFSGQRVIGIKYDLIDWPAVPESQQTPEARPPKRSTKNKPRGAKAPALAGGQSVIDENASPRVLKFPTLKPENANAPNEDLDELKNQVRHAMKLLEEGKQVAAFNILKHIIDN
jgi:hypothetical protein